MGKNRLRLGFNVFCIVVFAAALVGFQPVQAASNSGTPSQSAPSADLNPTPPPPDGLRVGYNSQTGKVSFIGGDSAHPLAAFAGIGASAVENAGKGVLAQFASAFGLKDPASELQLALTQERPQGSTLRYQQVYNGIPVLGGDLVLNSDAAGNLISLNGKISPELALSTTQPAISAEQAVKVALDGIQSWYKPEKISATATEPALWVYDERVFMPTNLPPVLAWRMELHATSASVPVNELVLVNAITGRVAVHFNQIDTAWSQGTNPPTPDAPPAAPAAEPGVLPNSEPCAGGAACAITYSTNHSTNLPGSTELCNTANVGSCTTNDTDGYKAHLFALGTYQLYWNRYGRNSIDNNGMTIVSTVHYDWGYENAFWSGYYQQMVYGDGYSTADDVVAHELTHGVTDNESNLYYYYQSGAINESLSDLWGEYYDQTNNQGGGNDSTTVKWLMGEDIPGGAIRSMSNPPAFGDPDKMTSPNFVKNISDSGGVHTNSGVNNKAVFLMVDGTGTSTFNGKKVLPLGWNKTGAIYYYAQTHLLTSASDYGDLYNALQQACSVLVGGAENILLSDCIQVKNALDAVQMSLSPSPTYAPEASLCPAGTMPSLQTLFFDDFEDQTTTQWTFGADYGNPIWSVLPFYPVSGNYSLFGDDYDPSRSSYDQISNRYATLSQPVTIPTGTPYYLHFKHIYGFEALTTLTGNFDGGVVEYSTDDGNTWKDASSLFSAGKTYSGKIYNGGLYYFDYPYWYELTPDNPLKGRSAFVGASNGYVSTRYNLASLAGKTVNFRWQIGTDSSGYALSWLIDDVSIYTCVGNPGVPALALPASGGLTTTYLPKLDWGNAANADHYELQVGTDAAFTAPSLIVDDQNVPASEYTFGAPLPDNSKYYWRVRTVNAAGVISAWSAANRYFRTPLVTPVLSTPANDAVTVLKNLRPTFSWSASTGAVSYTLTVSTIATMATVAHKATVLSPGPATPIITYTPLVDLPAGKTLYWRVQANGANPSLPADKFTFVTPKPPSVPLLLTPAVNALLTNYLPTLTWKASTVPLGAPAVSTYKVQVADNSNYTAPVYDRAVGSTSYTFTTPLLPNTKYYWRVQTCNVNDECSAWTAATARYFRTPLVTPVPSTPANEPNPAVFLKTLRPTFSWSASTGAVSYTLSVATNPAVTVIVHKATISSLYTSYTPTVDLPAGKTLYWQVQANGANPSPWSDTFIFSTPKPPSVPLLLTPAVNALLTNYLPTFTWKASIVPLLAPGLSTYRLQVDDDPTYSSTAYDGNSVSTFSTLIDPPLLANTKYYWRVQACNVNDECSSWKESYFRTSLAVPGQIEPANDAVTVLKTLRPGFSWSASPGAVSYTLTVSTIATMTTVVHKATVSSPTYTPPVDLPAGKILYWRVQANGANPSLLSGTFAFVTPKPPSVPVLLTPVVNALVSGYLPSLTWKASTVPLLAPAFSTYHLQVADNSNYTSPVYDGNTDLTFYTFTTPLAANTKYYWRVQACNVNNECSAWTAAAARYFRTPVAP